MAIAGRLLRRPVVLTYHCDVRLPPSLVNWLAGRASRLADSVSASAASAVVANTRDYAEASPFLRHFLKKLFVIPPPVELAKVSPAAIEEARWRWGVRPGDRVIGMAARLASEKGAEILAHAMPRVIERFPTARVLYIGQHLNVLGEGLRPPPEPLLESLGDHWRFLGVLPEQAAAFYKLCAVTALQFEQHRVPGMVQVESMLSGTPVVASVSRECGSRHRAPGWERRSAGEWSPWLTPHRGSRPSGGVSRNPEAVVRYSPENVAQD
jgi:glycosyltransferase involved in cell wall biosynthesis